MFSEMSKEVISKAVSTLSGVGAAAYLTNTVGAVAGLIVLILIVYFSYKFIKQKKIEKLMPGDLDKKNKENEKEEVAEKAREENTDIEGK